jgi:peptidoglycan/xylan/chitin deacetylase (PgdA/CDA1 family)
MYKNRIWEVETKEKQLFLTFDDGPHPSHSLFVLDELKKYNAKATFFCIGKNVAAYPDVYKRIIEDGHKVGNHTQDHLNAWKTPNDVYLKNVTQASNYIHSDLFRPPYGKINSFLVKQLTNLYQLKTVMWSVLSYDFDQTISSERCLQNVLLNSKAGSVIVFHDSEKASVHMRYALPKVLSFFAEKGFSFERLEG